MCLIILVSEIHVEFTNNCKFYRDAADRTNFSNLPPAANDISLVEKRKRGRPRKAKETVIPLVQKRKRGRPRKLPNALLIQ